MLANQPLDQCDVGLLTAHSVSVRSAALHTVATGLARPVTITTWRVDSQHPGDLPHPTLLSQELSRLQDGDSSMLGRVRMREQRASRRAQTATPFVEVVPEASATATVIEVRTGDRSGLLFALASSLSELRLSIRSAHVSTLAGQAIDTFYLTEADGTVPVPDRIQAAVTALTTTAGG